ncbi:MAG: hypothetical protein IKK43_05510 [Clostridia bacterium]|nr:hypothetical protein [Clostridia bacterium]
MEKKYRYEEHFVGRGYITKAAAIEKLEKIRDGHPASAGWVELDVTFEQDPVDKTWTVIRHHAKQW